MAHFFKKMLLSKKAKNDSCCVRGGPNRIFIDHHLTRSIETSSKLIDLLVAKQCDQKKWPNVNKSCPKLISLEK